MIGRRAIVGLCMLCALAFSAVAASAANAETKGTTAFTCKTTAKGGAGFSKEHCTPADAVESGAQFEHIGIAEETTTQVTGGNTTLGGETEVIAFKSTQAGIAEELQAKVLEKDPEVAMWMKNRKDPITGEHYIEGEGTLTYTEVTLTKPASATGCKIFGKEVGGVLTTENNITTKTLRATTKGQGDAIKIEPASGAVLAEFFITGCSIAALNCVSPNPCKAEGSLVAEVDGATIRTKEANITAQGTFKFRGQKAGLDSIFTPRGYDENAGQKSTEDVALSATTVSTP